MPKFFDCIQVNKSPKDATDTLLKKEQNKTKQKKKKTLTQQVIKPSLSTVYNQVSALSTNVTVSSCRQLTVFFSPFVRICAEANLP